MFNPKQLRHLYGSAGALGLNLADTSRWLWSYYASRLAVTSYHAGSVQIAIREHEDQLCRLVLRTNGFDWLVVEEVFLHDIYRLDLSDVRRVLDLGGNIGIAALYFASRYPGAQICTVEPIPENLSILKRNIELNELSVRIVPAAAGAQDGRTAFELAEDPRQHSKAVFEEGRSVGARVIEVDVLSVPSLMQLMEWQEIDLLKIDIEGGEREVLGASPPWLTKVRVIIGEGHLGVGYTFDAARRDLEPMGFVLELLSENSGAILFSAHRLA